MASCAEAGGCRRQAVGAAEGVERAGRGERREREAHARRQRGGADARRPRSPACGAGHGGTAGSGSIQSATSSVRISPSSRWAPALAQVALIGVDADVLRAGIDGDGPGGGGGGRAVDLDGDGHVAGAGAHGDAQRGDARAAAGGDARGGRARGGEGGRRVPGGSGSSTMARSEAAAATTRPRSAWQRATRMQDGGRVEVGVGADPEGHRLVAAAGVELRVALLGQRPGGGAGPLARAREGPAGRGGHRRREEESSVHRCSRRGAGPATRRRGSDYDTSPAADERARARIPGSFARGSTGTASEAERRQAVRGGGRLGRTAARRRTLGRGAGDRGRRRRRGPTRPPNGLDRSMQVARETPRRARWR